MIQVLIGRLFHSIIGYYWLWSRGMLWCFFRWERENLIWSNKQQKTNKIMNLMVFGDKFYHHFFSTELLKISSSNNLQYESIIINIIHYYYHHHYNTLRCIGLPSAKMNERMKIFIISWNLFTTSTYRKVLLKYPVPVFIFTDHFLAIIIIFII